MSDITYHYETETKFGLNYLVYMIEENKVKELKVIGIRVLYSLDSNKDEENEHITYILKDQSDFKSQLIEAKEKDIFNTKRELLESL